MIKVENLTKTFENITAVENISFDISESEIFAFLGPNDAGKTTTIRMPLYQRYTTFGQPIHHQTKV